MTLFDTDLPVFQFTKLHQVPAKIALGRCGGACPGESQMPPRRRRDRRIVIIESVRILKHLRAIQPR
jgi:hypothetical protein